MKTGNKIILWIVLITGLTLFIHFLWLSQRPVKIIAVHEDGHFSSVLVQNFPFTDKGKINWWLKNKAMLKEKYNIPKPASYGNFNITFWLFGDGYKEEGKYDRLCFADMKKKANCIEKDAIFSVNNSANMGIVFTVYDGTYILKKNGEIVKYTYQ
ncbi:DUF943 family protein [Enterobacteriaceae bacterium LUAb1]